MARVKYPTRARIIDVDSKPTVLVTADGLQSFVPKTPPKSRPHVGKEGLAEKFSQGVRITLDDGTILWGWECWWEPI
jgi:hypothetical protein